MHLVALHDPQGRGERAAAAVVSAVGLSLYEAKARLRQAAQGPAVLARFAEGAQARACVSALRASGALAGIAVWHLAPSEVETAARRTLAERLTLGVDEILAVPARGIPTALATEAVVLLLRGAQFSSQVENKVVKTKKISLGRAIASGGLIMTRTESRTTRTETHEREEFLHVYGRGGEVLALRQQTVRYAGLGLPLQPSQAGNFEQLVAELRRRLPEVPYDERLKVRTTQAAILGPALSPEGQFDVVVTLVAGALRPPTDP